MTRIRFLVVLIAALIFVGCTGQPEGIENVDWCWQFDFRLGLNGFTLLDRDEDGEPDGDLTLGEGITTKAGGLLSTMDGYNLSAAYAYTRLVSPSFVSVRIKRPVGVSGDINVVAIGNVFGVPIENYETLPGIIDEVTLTIEPETLGVSGQNVIIAINTSQPLIIEALELRGTGPTPFPVNQCPDGTMTPQYWTPTHTPTITATATTTPTATTTSTSTPTPSDTWVCTFDLTGQLATWTIGTQTGGAAPFGTLTGSGVAHTEARSPAASGAWFRRVDLYSNITATTLTHMEVTFDYTFGTSNAGTGSTPFLMFGTGPQDEGNFFYVLDRDEMSVESGTVTKDWDGSQSVTQFYVSINSDVRNANSGYTGSILVTQIVLVGGGTVPYTSGGGVSCDDPTPTPSVTPSMTHTLDPSITPPTSTPPSGTPPTSTPTVTRTPFPTGTPPPPSRTPIVLPSLVATSTIDPELTPDNTPQGGDAAGDAGQGLDGLARLADGIGNLVGGWTNGAGEMMSDLIGDFNSSDPEPIPGLPLCMSAPLEHDWCAIIYIIEWTILAPGTVGELIIPLLQIMFYVYAFIYLIRGVLWIVRRAESMTGVD